MRDLVLGRPDHIAASPADRAREALLDDAGRSNAEIALLARCPPAIVGRCRVQLTDLGVLAPGRYSRRTGFPRHKALPRPPRSLQEGSCVGVLPSLWVSDDPADRAEAVRICVQDCPVLLTCRTWSLSLPEDDLAIYGGTTASERARMRLARAGRPVPLRMTAAGKNAARDRRRAAARGMSYRPARAAFVPPVPPMPEALRQGLCTSRCAAAPAAGRCGTGRGASGCG